jgi:hypothetical protein
MFPKMPLAITSRIFRSPSRVLCLIGATILVILVFIAKLACLTHSELEDVRQHIYGSFSQIPNSIQALSLDLPTQRVSLSCNWSPTSNNTQCVKLLSSRMKASALGAEPSFRRWLFFGDSTMYILFKSSALRKILVDHSMDRITKTCPLDFSCTKYLGNRCNLNKVFGLQYRPERQWSPPNYTLGEGPVDHGLQHPYCHDCAYCYSELLACTRNLSNNRTCPDSTLKTLHYGGFINMEFARDVKMQSPNFGTSQENIALLFLNSTQWNQDLILSSFGPTACIIGVGFHDMAIPSITMSRFIDNVKWYLRLLHPTCGHFIWLANTAPAASTENLYAQGFNRTLEWNMAVHDLLESAPDFRHKSSFVDVFNASISFPHADNVHMSGTWYRDLGATFASLITSQT